MSSGNPFQRRGAMQEKAQSPAVFIFEFGITKTCLSIELRFRGGVLTLSKSLMYCDPMLFRALKVNSRILYSIRLHTGNQCNLARIGEICSYFLVPVRSRAAEFCTHCSLSSKQELILYNRELP